MLSEWTVRLRGEDLRPVGEVDTFTRIEIVARFNDVGTWIVDIPEYQLPLLQPGGGVIIRRAGQVVMAGPWTSRRRVRDGDSPNGVIELSGVADDVIIADRLAWPVPAQPVTNQSANAYDSRSGIAETVVKAYINANIGALARTERKVPGLTVEPNLARGTSVVGFARFDNLAELVSALLLPDGLGWQVVWNPGVLDFEVYQPQDLSQLVRFQWPEGALSSLADTLTAPIGTREIVAGDGEGTARIFRERGNPAAETDWGRRIERFVDRRDTSDTALMDQEGDQALTDEGPVVQSDVKVTDTYRLQYGRDYALGDIVTVVGDDTETANVVREAHLTVSGDGETVEPTIGTPNVQSEMTQDAMTKRLAEAVANEGKRH